MCDSFDYFSLTRSAIEDLKEKPKCLFENSDPWYSEHHSFTNRSTKLHDRFRTFLSPEQLPFFTATIVMADFRQHLFGCEQKHKKVC